jgi:hypothetical protein
MELVLLHSFNSFQLNHLLIEGYQIEQSQQIHSFPHHEDILPPLIPPEILFSKKSGTLYSIPKEIETKKDTFISSKKRLRNTYCHCPFDFQTQCQENESNLSKTWKINHNSPGGRLQISRRKMGTEWLWDNSNQENTKDYLQSSPQMTTLGWLIYLYEAPVVYQFLKYSIENIDIESREYTGLEYVQPIHLIFRYYFQFENVKELVTELFARGVNFEKKTSHGWLPIHYACRYSPSLLSWLIERVENKESQLNESLVIQPSLPEFSTTYLTLTQEGTPPLPLDIFRMNYDVEEDYQSTWNYLLSYGGQITQPLVHLSKPFVIEEPIVFHIGSSEIPIQAGSKRKTCARKGAGSHSGRIGKKNKTAYPLETFSFLPNTETIPLKPHDSSVLPSSCLLQ